MGIEAEHDIHDLISDTEEFKSGFTWRSILALVYSLLIFSPAAIYLSLVTLGGARAIV